MGELTDDHQPFNDLPAFMGIPRLSGLALSRDGKRLVTAVAALNPERTKWQTALWEIDPAGAAVPRRLTRSAPGESGACFLPNGDLLFTSARPDPNARKNDREPNEEPKPSLWLLPAGGGEARLVLTRAAGVVGIAASADSGDVAFVAAAHPGQDDDEADAARRKARKDAGVTAILHEAYPVRFWDADLGPAWPHVLFLGQVPAEGDPIEPRDLTPDAALTFGETATQVELSADGRWLVRTADVGGPLPTERRSRLELIDVSSGDVRVLAAGDDVSFDSPHFSPDGQQVLCHRSIDSTFERAPSTGLWLVDVATGSGCPLADDLDRWPVESAWSADGSAVYFVADEDGHAPVFRVEVTSGEIVKLTRAGSHSCLQVAADGTVMYAMVTGWDHPLRPVRLDPMVAGQEPSPLRAPGAVEHLPGTLERVGATAPDGVRIPSWLVLSEGVSAQSPAPLVLWAHGGPLGSWNSWSWRWCPWLLAARGYAVLLPDPALSTGYGQDFVQRGWGQWGGSP